MIQSICPLLIPPDILSGGDVKVEVELERDAWKTIHKVSKKYFPMEACGLLTGERSGEKIKVKEANGAENVLESRTAFKIEPSFVLEVMEKAKKKDQELVGFFHSHPGFSAFVSPRDEKFMKLWLEKVWIVAGLNRQAEVTEVKAFWPAGDVFEEVKIRRV